MKGDFTRDTFDPRNNYTSVLMQQGRVQVDADWNEQAAIARHQLRTFIADIVGPHGGPRADGDGGFKIAVTADGELVVGPGRYYVGGLMCENDTAVNYTTQPGYPFDGEPTPDQLHAPGESLLYLDVWERHVSSFERPDREVALDGPDTATRAQLVWQVKVLLPEDGRTPHDYAAATNLPAHGSGTMRARTAGYLGVENQLYRVEIHRGGTARGDAATGGATFKWSRANGSVAFPILGRTDARGTVTVRLGPRGPDRRLPLNPGDWVELSDDTTVLGAGHPPLLAVASVDHNELDVALTGTLSSTVADDQSRHPVLRRWDHDGGPANGDEGALLVVESADDAGWIDLEGGIQIQFPHAAGNTYRTGDYWLVPARTATADIEWPTTTDATGTHWPAALPPRGITHHYAPLAVITSDGMGGFSVKSDCRRLFSAPP